MKTILCPVDFSPASKAACRFAAEMGKGDQLHVILVHCFDVPSLFSQTPMTMVREAEVRLRKLAELKLNRIRKNLERDYPGLRIETFVAEGPPAVRLVELAVEKGVDLIAMGATGLGKLKRVMMGSVASKVVREAPCAVLTVPRAASFKGVRRIAYATDLKEDNIRAASSLVPFAKLHGAELAFIYVDDRHLLHDDKTVEAMTLRIRKRISYPRLSGYIAKDADISKGLERFLKKYPADFLVMFSHERHFPETMLHQSITRLVSHRLDLPILSFRHSDRPAL
jgi:nucleotide-binding universal stress UspA family protein